MILLSKFFEDLNHSRFQSIREYVAWDNDIDSASASDEELYELFTKAPCFRQSPAVLASEHVAVSAYIACMYPCKRFM